MNQKTDISFDYALRFNDLVEHPFSHLTNVPDRNSDARLSDLAAYLFCLFVKIFLRWLFLQCKWMLWILGWIARM